MPSQLKLPPVLQAACTPSSTIHRTQPRLYKTHLLVAEFIIAVQAQQDNCRGREDLKKFDQDSKREMHQQGEKARARMSSVFPWHYQQA